ncbi:MAG: hypothetical protein M3362_06900 [Acidobacteriota bacterium]|nr:hypothetical protein [Acidobacteriota bacterium]
MNNFRCVQCGFLNFSAATVCKRCKAEFAAAPEQIVNPASTNYETSRQPSYQATGYGAAAQWPQPAYPSPLPPPPIYLPSPIAPLPRTSRNGATNAVLWTLLGLTIFIAVGIGFIWRFAKPAQTLTGWQEYTSQDGSYTVQMPIKPYESEESQQYPAGQLTMHVMMASMQEKGIYVAAYTDYPNVSKNVSTKMLLDFAAQGAVNNSGATMLSKKEITLGGYQGIEVEMDVPASKIPGGGKATCRIYWASPRIYILFVGGSTSSGVYESRSKFLDSFMIKKGYV